MTSKSSRKWIAWLMAVGSCTAIYLAAGAFLEARAEDTLSQVCQRPVTVQAAQPFLPLGVRLRGVQVSPAGRESAIPFSAEEVRVCFVLRRLLQGSPKRESISRIRVRKGKLIFVDAGVDPNVSWCIQRLDGTVELKPNRQYEFRLDGILQTQEGGESGDLHAEGGWVSQGPLDAKILLRHEKIGLLASYLRRILGSAPDQGSIQLESRITVHQGVLMAYHDVTARGISFPTDQPTTLGLDGNRLAQLLTDAEGKARFNFIVTGRLDGKLDWSHLAAGAMQEALRQAMAKSIQRMLETTEQRPLEERVRKQMESIER